MSKLTKTVLQRPVAALVIVVSLIIFGISSIAGMNLQLIPDMDMSVLLVMTVYPQAGPEDVERLVTEKIEDGCGTISGLDNTYSYSQENMSMVMFSFEYGTDMDDAFIDMQEAIERVKRELPDDAEDPTIIAMDMNAAPVMMLSVDAAEEGSDINVLGYVEDTVEPELKKVSDVADVEISGGDDSYISIELIPELVQQYRLDISTIANTVASANFTIPAGTAAYGGQSLNVTSTAEYKTPAELATIPITTPSGNIIHLSDIASVHYAVKEPGSYSRYNGTENVSVSISKIQSSSAVTLSNKVTSVIDRLNAANPDIKITPVYDSSDTIIDSIVSIAETLLVGIVITMLVLFIFFGDFKGSLIVGSSMPISLLVTFLLMKFMGFSLNMITMGALVIGIGMMVDNAIVVIEMCFRRRDEGMSFIDAAYDGTKTVISSIVASTITTIVVYLPLAMMEGMSGQMFGQLGYTIVFALLASLISSVTLVPLCFSQYRPVEKKETKVNRFLEIVGEKYVAILRKALHKKLLVSVIAIVIFVISIFLVQFLNMELMGQTDEGQVAVTVEFRPGTNLETIDAKVRELEQFVKESPYIDDYSATATESSASGSVQAYVADGCKLSTSQIVDEWTVELNQYEDNCEISVASSSSMGMSSMGGGNTYDIALQSNDLEKLKEGCRIASDAAIKAKGVISASSSLSDAATKAKIIIDPIKAAAAGMTPQMASGAIYSMMSGSNAMDVMIDGKEYTVTVEFPADEYETVNDIYGITLTNTSGVSVPLSDIGEIVYTDSPQTIVRKDGMYQGTVTATLEADAKFSAQETIRQQMAETFLPEGVEQVTNTMNEMMMEEFTSLITAIITAILLVYIVMAIQFENLRYSGMVMFCIPFSLIGSILLLLITRCTVSMVSLMGFLMLVGIVVNNGILYVDYTNMLRKTMSTEEALVETGKSRLRPILMTTLTTILSMIPMAVGVGKNGQMTQGMAVVIVGGLTASTILTLILLPTFYMIIHKRSKAKKAKKKARREGKELTV
jgi:HAE1 family hydrophobic/amphiphilic exporter-1